MTSLDLLDYQHLFPCLQVSRTGPLASIFRRIVSGRIPQELTTWLDDNAPGWSLNEDGMVEFTKPSHAVHFKLRFG